MTYQQLFKTLKQWEQEMAKTLNDADNQSTTSDTSSTSNRMKMRLQDEEEFDASIGDTEQETDTIKYFCSKCMFTCVDVNLFVRHWSDINKKNVFVCCVYPCIKWYQTSAGLRQHVKGHHSDVLTCEDCGLVCLSPLQLSAHIDTHANAKYVCSACDKDFTRSDDKNKHFKYRCPKNPNRVMRCKHCIKAGVDPDVSGSEPGLMTHLQSVHKLKGVYLCSYCHNLFPTSQKIEVHQKNVIETIQIYEH